MNRRLHLAGAIGLVRFTSDLAAEPMRAACTAGASDVMGALPVSP